MKKAVFAVLFAAALLLPAVVGAQPLELKLARVLSWQKKYDEALVRYRSYIGSHPNDARARLEMGDICFWTEDYSCAMREYEAAKRNPRFATEAEKKLAKLAEATGDLAMSEEHLRRILASEPSNQEARLKLARVLSYGKRYPESIAEFDAAIAADPENAAALSERADVLSWDDRYGEAVESYDASLAIRFDPKVARQKARVLGWWKKFGDAIDAYDEAYEKSGVEGIALERDGKEAFWNGWVLKSIERYRRLLDSEPENVEGRFDLGQVEGYQRMWKDAAENFGRILEKQPWHFRAEDSLEKIGLMRSKRLFVPHASWLYARSDSRDTHIKRLSAGGTISQPLADHAQVTAGYSFDDFLFSGAGSIPRHQGKIGAGAWLSPRLFADASFLPTGYPSDDRMSWL
ncbi:MAG TPA: tetratricopeptide repeat protein, partial [bacterium]|nr:tetratricopeptide repeat protein [bacterium]